MQPAIHSQQTGPPTPKHNQFSASGRWEPTELDGEPIDHHDRGQKDRNRNPDNAASHQGTREQAVRLDRREHPQRNGKKQDNQTADQYQLERRRRLLQNNLGSRSLVEEGGAQIPLYSVTEKTAILDKPRVIETQFLSELIAFFFGN